MVVIVVVCWCGIEPVMLLFSLLFLFLLLLLAALLLPLSYFVPKLGFGKGTRNIVVGGVVSIAVG